MGPMGRTYPRFPTTCSFHRQSHDVVLPSALRRVAPSDLGLQRKATDGDSDEGRRTKSEDEADLTTRSGWKKGVEVWAEDG